MFKKIIRVAKFSLSCAAAGAIVAASGYVWLGSDHAGEKVSKLLSGYCKSDISIKKISGNFLNKTDFNDFTMSARAGGEKKSGVEIIKADSASAKYSILSILRNQKLTIRDFDFNNMSVNFVDMENEAMIEPAAFFNSAKKTIADLFYGYHLGVSVNKININRLRLAFDNIDKTAGGTINFAGLKIIPVNALMNAYQFESSLEMHKGRNLVIPFAAVKGEIDLSKMAMSIYIEAERVKLANFNWLLKYFTHEILVEDGNMFISAAVNYSQACGFQIFGSASAKNLSLINRKSPFKIIGNTVNINFNENSLRITDSVFKAEDIAFIVNGTISDIFSSAGMKTILTLKSLNGGAGKYFDAIKKYSGFGGTAGHYYSTGFIDAEIKVYGTGMDYLNWKHQSAFTLKNVDIASQKISLVFERLNGRIEGDSNGFKTSGPLFLKTSGRWHELNGEIKNYKNPEKMAYNFSFKEYSSSFYNDHLISKGEDDARQYFVAFDYDENDESWGGDGGRGEASFALIRANINKNRNGFFSSVNAKFENIHIDGLFGLKNARAGAELIIRNDKTALNNLIVRLPDKTMRGDLKIFPKNGAMSYALNFKKSRDICEIALRSNEKDGHGLNLFPPAAVIIKLAGSLESIEKDIKPYFSTGVTQSAGSTLKDISTEPGNKNTSLPNESECNKSQKLDQSALDLNAVGTQGLLKL
jgi:hypothetical protein